LCVTDHRDGSAVFFAARKSRMLELIASTRGWGKKNSYSTSKDGRALGGHNGGACIMSSSGGSSKRRQQWGTDRSDGGRRSGRSSVGAGCAQRSDGAVGLVDGHETCSRGGLSTCGCLREVAAEL
jgi:hypothetical protein